VSSRVDYQPIPKGVATSFVKHKSRYGMVSRSTMVEASFAYGEGIPSSTRGGFDMTLGGGAKVPTREDTVARFRTTMQDAMEEGAQIGREATDREHRDLTLLQGSRLSKPAGGKPNLELDRGRHTAGISGEKLNLDGDARRNTISQRSWTYGPDPGLKFVTRPELVTARAEVTGMSLVLEGSSAPERAPAGAMHGRFAAFAAPSRKSTDVTLILGGGKAKKGQVFADFPA